MMDFKLTVGFNFVTVRGGVHDPAPRTAMNREARHSEDG